MDHIHVYDEDGQVMISLGENANEELEYNFEETVIKMNLSKEAALEAMLFASGESVPVKRLAEVLELSESKTVKMLENLKNKYDVNEKQLLKMYALTNDGARIFMTSDTSEKLFNISEYISVSVKV